MQISRLDTMHGGWFVGDFTPSLLTNTHVEVAVQHFPASYCGATHTHHVALEITVIISGVAMMNGIKLVAGDMVTVFPGEVATFRAVEDTTTVVVKSPSIAGDKYCVSEQHYDAKKGDLPNA